VDLARRAGDFLKRSARTINLPIVMRHLAFVTGCSMLLALSGCKTETQTAQTAPAPAPIVIPEGSLIEVQVNEALSTARNRAGDPFTATLELPVDIGGREVVPRGSRIQGHVTTSRSSGRMEGRAAIGITLDSIEYHGQTVPMVTTLDTKTSAAHKKRNIELVGGGSGLGAVIGAIAGGGKGAAIGALAGGGAGAGAAAATGKLEVGIPAETVFTFKLKSAIELH
jgi:hypothetical protein